MPPVPVAGFPANPVAGGDQHLYLKCIYVGLGDCSVIMMPNGTIAMIDCGSARYAGVTANQVRAELPNNHGITRTIDLLVMTHPDRDHYSLIGDVLVSTPITTVRHSMQQADYALYKFRQWYWNTAQTGPLVGVTVNAGSPNQQVLLDGGTLTNGNRVRLYAVASNVPSASRVPGTIKNTASVVVVCRDDTANTNLFTIAADATCETENFMLAGGRMGRISNVQIMRIAHHGSDTSSRTTFVQAANPSFASVVSSSQNNGNFCLPKQSVMTRWLNQMPGGAPQKTVGYWLDGAGTECRAAPRAEDDDRPSMGDPEVGVPQYQYGTAQVTKRMYETFLDGSKTWQW
jgi:competence protein ComEC